MITNLINKSVRTGRGELSEECIRSTGHPKPKPEDQSFNSKTLLKCSLSSNLQLRCVAELLAARRDVAGGSGVPGAANTINTSAISHVGANVKAV